MRKWRATSLLLLLLLIVGAATFQQAQAAPGAEELCALNPGLHAAINDTLTKWPPTGYEDTDTYRSLMYFWGAVIKDAEWCQNGRRGDAEPDLVERTMTWHYGNASEFMRQYEALRVASTPTATPATPTQATQGTDELCALNPGLHAAITDTLASWPPTGYEDTDTYRSLMYFWGGVIKDAEWCQNWREGGVDPDLVERTMRWHYGNASEFMRQYQAMVQGETPTATPTTVPATVTPTPVPPWVQQRLVEHNRMPTNAYTLAEPDDAVWIAVSYENDTQWNLHYPDIDIRFIDASSAPITEWLTDVIGGGLSGVTRPGELGYGRVYVPEDRVPVEWHAYELRIRSPRTNLVPYEGLTTRRVVAQLVVGSNLGAVSGFVKNEGPITILRGGVVVVVRNANGTLRSVNWSYFNRKHLELGRIANSALAPGEEVEFLIYISEIPHPGTVVEATGVAWSGWAGEE